MTTSRVRQIDFFSSLPPEWPSDSLSEQVAEEVRSSGRVVVVLDDDPTGTQTVHDVPVLAEWTGEALASALRRALLKAWDREVIAARAQSRSWEKVAQEVLEEFHQVIEGAKRK